MSLANEAKQDGDSLLGRSWSKIIEFGKKIKKIGQEDPRRIVHSLKFGLAITLVSLLYYLEPLYVGFGVSAMWAVLTVVVVFEFSVGATLGRGLNRAVATFLAAALGFGAQHIAHVSGDIARPIVLGLTVFILAVAVTFFRFFPRMKARYDYGLLIFILTFCMVSVSGYRDEQILEMAHQRVATILIGGFTSLLVCIVIFPVWAGDDLHSMIVSNIDKLSVFLQGFGTEYFQISEDGNVKVAIPQGYKTILNSKQSEESLVNFARWEPGHGKFRFRHPWKQYLKIGILTRECAFRIDALNGHLNSETQEQKKSEIRIKIRETGKNLCSESAKAFRELASGIKTMTCPFAEAYIANSKELADTLKSLLKTDLPIAIDLLEVVPTATVASILIDIVSCTEKIAESIAELASMAGFMSMEGHTRTEPDHHHHVINIDHSSPIVQGNHNSTGTD